MVMVMVHVEKIRSDSSMHGKELRGGCWRSEGFCTDFRSKLVRVGVGARLGVEAYQRLL